MRHQPRTLDRVIRVSARVLLIDDDERLFELLGSYMEKNGVALAHAIDGKSGLTQRVRESMVSEAKAERETIAFLQQHVLAGKSPMCGNSICQDRRFLARCMPELEKFFHYRNLDVRSLKELVMPWAPEIPEDVGGFLALDL